MVEMSLNETETGGIKCELYLDPWDKVIGFSLCIQRIIQIYKIYNNKSVIIIFVIFHFWLILRHFP